MGVWGCVSGVCVGGCVCVGGGGVWEWVLKRRQTRTHVKFHKRPRTHFTQWTVLGSRGCYLDHDLDWVIGWSPWLGSEKSHYAHGWKVVCQPGVLGWRIHIDCPRLEAITGGCVWGRVCVWGGGVVGVCGCVWGVGVCGGGVGVGVCVGVCVCVWNRSKWVDAFEGLLNLVDMGVSEI